MKSLTIEDLRKTKKLFDEAVVSDERTGRWMEITLCGPCADSFEENKGEDMCDKCYHILSGLKLIGENN